MLNRRSILKLFGMSPLASIPATAAIAEIKPKAVDRPPASLSVNITPRKCQALRISWDPVDGPVSYYEITHDGHPLARVKTTRYRHEDLDPVDASKISVWAICYDGSMIFPEVPATIQEFTPREGVSVG